MAAPKLKDPYGKVVDDKTIKNDQGKNLPPSSFAEPSEPSDHAPEDNPKGQLTKPQEENPQAIAHKPGFQTADGRNKSTKASVPKSKL